MASLYFYNGALGAASQQEKMANIANNLANIHTSGYKAQNATFSELINYNMGLGTEEERVKTGVAMRLDKTDTRFDQGQFLETGNSLDYAISGRGFFAVQNPDDGTVSYTRDGTFQIAKTGTNAFHLVTASGKRVLDVNGNPIPVSVKRGENNEDLQVDEAGNAINQNSAWTATAEQDFNIGIYEFPVENGLQPIGNNEYTPVAKNGTAVLSTTAELERRMVEGSNVDMAYEISRIIESQRAYSYALKLVQASSEIGDIVGGLR